MEKNQRFYRESLRVFVRIRAAKTFSFAALICAAGTARINQARETMARRSTMYRSNKRKKELLRQKKQEEKRLRRQGNIKASSRDTEGPDKGDAEAGSSGAATGNQP